MTAIDWAIVVFALLLVPLGLRQGFVVGALSLAGFVAGAFIGGRVGPLVLSEGASSPYAPIAALMGGILIGGVFAIFLESIGIAIRARLVRNSVVGAADAGGGAAVLVVLAFGIAWVIGAVALNTPGLKEYRGDVQRSTILSAMNEILPPSGPLLNVLNRIDPTPVLEGPSAEVAAPSSRILKNSELQAAAGSAVRISGTACGLNVVGSGWVAAPGVVVTNAHVVAGTDDTTVETLDGATFDADATFYGPKNDIAVLSAPELPLAPLPLAADTASGTPGAVVGYPGGGDRTVVPARLGSTGTVRSQDSYGRGPIEREMTSFRAEVMSGNSGGPLIDGQGEVLTTVFAASTSSRSPEGLGVPNSITERALADAGGSISTGPCA